ncbi:MAG: GNAT family N-acetyltransferase [Anaerolineales bacterium]|nr:GNAT family N-acetyltransferase [Anaerolineales bacterium]
MRPRDVEESAEVLSIAMVTNPIHVAVYQGDGEDERKQIHAKFIRLLRGNPHEVIIAKIGMEVVGVCRFYPCDGNRVITNEVEELLEAGDSNLVGFTQRDGYWRGVWARRDPNEHHSHLGPIGVLPQHQSKGIGRRMMEEYCRALDEKRMPGYLETDRTRNVPFYKQFDFEVCGEEIIMGVMNYFMWREAQGL